MIENVYEGRIRYGREGETKNKNEIWVNLYSCTRLVWVCTSVIIRMFRCFCDLLKWCSIRQIRCVLRLCFKTYATNAMNSYSVARMKIERQTNNLSVLCHVLFYMISGIFSFFSWTIRMPYSLQIVNRIRLCGAVCDRSTLRNLNAQTYVYRALLKTLPMTYIATTDNRALCRHSTHAEPLKSLWW